ncbi:MAG: monovalent cation/H+ antiporter complex subunit F [Porphyrobacter sp.]|jgi:multicomponent Na+:H+ antiporter subunit F|nr:monovalent cation/H+ antiporter complex subunit F [Porphyrobacter sp.]
MSDLAQLADLLALALCGAVVLTGWRLVRGPSFADRFVAFDMLTALGIGFAGLTALTSGRGLFVDIALALALINFVGTIAFALFLERKARD